MDYPIDMLAIVFSLASLMQVAARGLLLLYRPRDISKDCVFSRQLRYDLSFGNGLSDTITLVFRTLNEIDYECGVEIVTEPSIFLLVVIRFPNSIGTNCETNSNAFTVFKKNLCFPICDEIGDRDKYSPYFIISVRSRIRFKFLSNSSINTDMGANLYQVTATAARKKPRKGCDRKNESICAIDAEEFCFTSGVVCDGIKNCGVSDWFDERKSDCELPVDRIGIAPVIAVVAVIMCLSLAASHILVRYLPPLANSFFIFNANEDNRLCIDPVFRAPDYSPCDIDKAKRVSIIPVSSSSDEKMADEPQPVENVNQEVPAQDKNETTLENDAEEARESVEDTKKNSRRKTTMRTVTEMFQQRLRAVTGIGRRSLPNAEDF